MKQECLPLGGVLSQITALEDCLDNFIDLSHKGTKKYTSNLDTIAENSILNVKAENVYDNPTGCAAWGFVITLVHSDSNTFRTQIWIDMLGPNIWTRYKAGPGVSYTAWKQIAFTS